MSNTYTHNTIWNICMCWCVCTASPILSLPTSHIQCRFSRPTAKEECEQWDWGSLELPMIAPVKEHWVYIHVCVILYCIWLLIIECIMLTILLGALNICLLRFAHFFQSSTLSFFHLLMVLGCFLSSIANWDAIRCRAQIFWDLSDASNLNM